MRQAVLTWDAVWMHKDDVGASLALQAGVESEDRKRAAHVE